MKPTLLSLISVILFTSPSALGQDKLEFPQQTGNSFLRVCSAVETGPQSHTEIEHAAACVGYATGFIEGIEYLTVIKSPKPFCVPAKVENGQAVRVVLKYVREHPETAHLPTAQLMVKALREAYPCAAHH